MQNQNIFITGANGQLGTELRKKYPQAKYADIEELDITSAESVNNYDWSGIEVLINAAAYTNVDGAQTDEGRKASWNVNAMAVSNLTNVAKSKDITLVHISTDYVFDGTISEYTEADQFAPLSVYGASKAAGDLVVSQTKKHYLLRTSWVIGQGKNFVRTMMDLASKNISPNVVSDQVGRLTFTSELVRAIDHLLVNQCEFGTYNLTNDGSPASWAEITRKIFESLKRADLTVSDTTTKDYYKNKENIAPRPLNSVLNLAKIQSTGFKSNMWEDELNEYVKRSLNS